MILAELLQEQLKGLLKRGNCFIKEAIAGQKDSERTFRTPTHIQEVPSELLNMAVQKPRSIGYSFELWNFELMQRTFKECWGVHLFGSTTLTWTEAEEYR